ncbi:MAG: FAD-dependent oxidoreductase [Bacteroidota bacterium]
MDRRDFLNKTIIALPALGLFPALFTGCRKEDLSPINTDKQVTVIGAGMAGLAAAWYFNQRGVAVTVLEARDRIGGRTYTDRSTGFPFDEGASWIHGPRRNPITDLAEEAGATTYETNDDSVKVYNLDGTEYDEDTLSDAEKEYEDALEEVQENGSRTQSFQLVFENLYPNRVGDRLWTYMLSAFLEFDSGGDIGNLSSLDFADDEVYRGADLLITNGYDTIASHLAEGLDIRLEQVVESIITTGNTVSILTDTDTFQADLVVVTLPLGVLKSGNIDFVPALPDNKQEAIDHVAMGAVNKYLLLWDSPFWDTELQYIGVTPEERGKFNYFLNARTFSDSNGLMTFTFGNYSRTAEALSDTEIIATAMEHLRAIYPGAPDPHTLLRTRWNTDPYSFGAYSFATNGTRTTDFDTLAEPIEDTIFFAGEHTTREYRGTVHGAYESGLREARRIAELLGG